MSFTGLPDGPTPCSFGELGSLELRQLVEDPIREFALRRAIIPVVRCPQLATVLGELQLQQVVLGWLAGDLVSVLGEHDRGIASGYEVSHLVHAWPAEAEPTLPGVHDLCEDLIPLSGRVLSQGFDLLGEGVATLSLLLRGHTGVQGGSWRPWPFAFSILKFHFPERWQ